MTQKLYSTYILANQRGGTLYTGVTSNLSKRIWEHKNKIYKGFTSKYGCDKLVYYEHFDDVTFAILREKQIKAGSRNGKLKLINAFNSEWKDLYEFICG